MSERVGDAVESVRYLIELGRLLYWGGQATAAEETVSHAVDFLRGRTNHLWPVNITQYFLGNRRHCWVRRQFADARAHI